MTSHLLRPETWLDEALSEPPLTISPHASISEALATMNRERASYILIVEGQRLEGIFTERDVVKLASQPAALQDRPISEVMTRNTISLERDRLDSIFQALDLMRSHNIRHLPIVDKSETLLGIITPERIRAILQPTDLLKMRRVVDVVSNSVLSAPATASVLEIVQLMLDARKSCVVIVTPAPKNALIPTGIVTERDIVRFQSTGLDLADTACGSVMSVPLLPISLNATLWEAHQTMQCHRIRRLVVVATDGTLAGLITQTSILQALDPVELCLTVQQLRDLVSQTTQQLQQANERMRDELQQRQQIESQLRQLNQRLEEQSERQMLKLIHSEKMAALGQLMVGIAHDLSGPIAALKVSAANLSEGFGSAALQKLLEFIGTLPPEIRQNFWALVRQSEQPLDRRSRRGFFQLQEAICQQLEELDIPQAEDIAETLIELGIEKEIDRFEALLIHPDCEQILDWVVQFVSLQKSLQLANTATEQTASAITALKNYVRQDFAEEKILARITDGIDTVLALHQNAFKHGIDLLKNCDETLPEILCYPSDLKQVWMNLIQNSLYAMPERGTLTVEVQQQDDFVRVAIQDSGTGISPEIQEMIFQPFFTTKPLGEGGGLGLNIVKKIVEKHRGRIYLESVPGQTKFTILLPIEIPS